MVPRWKETSSTRRCEGEQARQGDVDVAGSLRLTAEKARRVFETCQLGYPLAQPEWVGTPLIKAQRITFLGRTGSWILAGDLPSSMGAHWHWQPLKHPTTEATTICCLTKRNVLIRVL